MTNLLNLSRYLRREGAQSRPDFAVPQRDSDLRRRDPRDAMPAHLYVR